MSNLTLLSHSAVADLADRVPSLRLHERSGTVSTAVGLTIEVTGLSCAIGEQVLVDTRAQQGQVLCQVVGFRSNRVILMPFGDPAGISVGGRAVATGREADVVIGDDLLGRVLDGLGNPLDGGAPIRGRRMGLHVGSAAHPLRRKPISEPLVTGVRVFDAFLTCGMGQRLGIFAGSGVGKSSFLGMIARNSSSDVNVIALIGERGREVREFLEQTLGEEGLRRSVVVAATSDQPALVRRNAAWVATAIAEYFRDRGKNVLFMMDSVTRFAMAQREIGLATGEPPTTRGYTPSVFAMLPLLLERTGSGEHGTITGLYTVLVEGDDLNEPITDAVRGILDGHIVLSRELATSNHYPAVDVLASISRLMSSLATSEHRARAGRLRNWLAAHRSVRDLLEIGAYVSGSNPEVDAAVARMPHIQAFLRQDMHDVTSWSTMQQALEALTR